MRLTLWRVLAAAGALLALAAAAVALVLGGCPSSIETASGAFVPMKCAYAVRAAALLQVMAAASMFGLVPVKCKVGRRWLAGMTVLAQALAAVALYTPCIGLCSDSAMHCHATALACTLTGLCAAVVAIVLFVLADPKRASRPRRGL